MRLATTIWLMVAALCAGCRDPGATGGDGGMGSDANIVGDMTGSQADLTMSTDGPPGDGNSGDGGGNAPMLASLGSLALTGNFGIGTFTVGAAGTAASGKAFLPDNAGKVHVVDTATRAETAAPSFFTGGSGIQVRDIAVVGANVVGCWSGAPGGGGNQLYAAAFGASGFGTPAVVTGAAGCQAATAIPGGTLLAVAIRDPSTLTNAVKLFDSASAWASGGSIATTAVLGTLAASTATIAGISGDNTVNFIDVASKMVLGTASITNTNGLATPALAFNGGGTTLYGSNGTDVKVITVATRTVSGTIASDPLALGTGGGFILSSDGKYIVFAGYDAQGKELLQVHRVSDGMTIQSVPISSTTTVDQIRMAADGTVIVLVGNTTFNAQFYSFQ